MGSSLNGTSLRIEKYLNLDASRQQSKIGFTKIVSLANDAH
jgi:hypothetical protein